MMSADELEDIACRVAASVSRRVGHIEPIEDLQQEARMAIIAGLASYRAGGMDLAGYLWVKARNACIDYVRSIHGDGSRPAIMPLEDRAGIIDLGLEAVEIKDSHRKARRIARMQDREKPSKSQPIERVGGPGKVGGPVTVCGILFERVSRGVLMTLPNGQTASCDLLHFKHAMHLLFGDKPKES